MSHSEPLIRSISDTALWTAYHRSLEGDRPDAIFRDPLARRLAGTRGEQIALSFPNQERYAWTWVARTYLFDRYINEQVKDGVDLVVNLAAGLDARPYRMNLPSSLEWVEVDLPPLLDYKEEILKNETPVCKLERIRLDLSDENARLGLFSHLGNRARKVLIVTEGLLIYLPADRVAALARDLAQPSSFRLWTFELASPGLLQLLSKQFQPSLDQGGARLQFAPPEGPSFFLPHGWKPLEINSLLKTAARLKRLSFGMRLLALFPESKSQQGSRPWSGICLFARN
jgi:methyltransferase (TIGR00027 family)